ncbi:hypothetical protein E2542_SST20250 [Spatholobus suberectus]|nr:hypothetical protein E2542_SST20250 [Spatholobus suberectus]
MKTQNMKFIVLAVCLAVCVGTCWGDLVEDAKAKAAEAKDAAVPTVNAAKDAAEPTVDAAMDAAAPTVKAATEKSESFAQWAYDKISHGLGFKAEEEKPLAQNTMYQAEDAASKTKTK